MKGARKTCLRLIRMDKDVHDEIGLVAKRVGIARSRIAGMAVRLGLPAVRESLLGAGVLVDDGGRDGSEVGCVKG